MQQKIINEKNTMSAKIRATAEEHVPTIQNDMNGSISQVCDMKENEGLTEKEAGN